LGRFDAEYVEAALAASGRGCRWRTRPGFGDDLVPDVTQILTSVCALLHRRRAAAGRAQRAVEAVIAGRP
jgi:predicted site-specific integrase-resolvase